MRFLIPAALAFAIGLPGIAFAAPQAGSAPAPAKQRTLAQCDKIKTPAARQDCRKKALASKPAARKPVRRSAQRKPPAKKPVHPVATGSTASVGSVMM